jgi:hypothetical protein
MAKQWDEATWRWDGETGKRKERRDEETAKQWDEATTSCWDGGKAWARLLELWPWG